MLQVGTVDLLSTSGRSEKPLLPLRAEEWRGHQQATELAGSQTSLENLPVPAPNTSPTIRELQRSPHHPEPTRPQDSVHNAVDPGDTHEVYGLGCRSSGSMGLGSLRSEVTRRPRPNQARSKTRSQREGTMARVEVRQRTLQTERE